MPISNQDIYKRMNILDSAMSIWVEAEKLWIIAYKKFKQGHPEAIYLGLINIVTMGMNAGITKVNFTFRALSKEYDDFSANPKFVRLYNDRIEMLEIVQDDLQTHMLELHGAMTINPDANSESYDRFQPEYQKRFERGDARVQELVKSLEQTKETMQSVISKSKL